MQCCAEVTLLGEPLPLPGFSLVLGYQPDDSSKTKIVEMVRKRYKVTVNSMFVISMFSTVKQL